MMDRREFVKSGVLAGLGFSLAGNAGRATRAAATAEGAGAAPETAARGPRMISTWRSGIAANTRGLEVIKGGGKALDAVQQGVMVVEADPENMSVGYGGLPNAEGVVELDAAIMDGASLEAGSVAALQGIMHPVAVARKVMEETPHVLLVGDGARRFALSRGFESVNLLTPEALKAWQERGGFRTRETTDDHDTIGMVAMDVNGDMAATCTTSGLSWKLPGRVGDSPLVGHGLYCDNRAGGAAATGVGEEVIKVCGSYQVVEFMRQGLEPVEAIRRVLERILRRDSRNRERQVAFVAMRADGEVGYASLRPGFQASVYLGGEHELRDATSLIGKE